MGSIESVILGMIQGATEFIPVSSSGHLWLAQEFIFGHKASTAFTVFLHLGTVLAVLIFFWEKIWALLSSLWEGGEKNAERTYVFKLALATLTTAPIAFLLKPFVEHELTPFFLGMMLLVTTALILITEYAAPRKHQELSWKAAFFLGVVQSLAVLPGLSRSGTTLAYLLLSGIERKKSLEISFLLSLPTTLGAIILMIPEFGTEQFSPLSLLLGGLSSLLVGLLAIHLLWHHLQKIWIWCAPWCFVLGTGLLFF